MSKPDLTSVDPHTSYAPVTVEMLVPVKDLNRRLLAILLEESEGSHRLTGGAANIGRLLRPLSDEMHDRLASAPICLLDAGFNLEFRWTAITAEERRHEAVRQEELALPLTHAEKLAPLLYFTIASTAATSPEAARLIFGLSRASMSAVAGVDLLTSQWLSENRAHWIAPRWCHQLHVWERLVQAAEQGLQPLCVTAISRMLADLGLATAVSNQTRRIR